MRRKRVIRKAFATLSVFLALLLVCGIAFPSQARAEEAETETRPIAHNAVVLVLDDSGSMSGSPTERLREAAKKFSEKILEADKGAKIAIVAFSNLTETLPFTSNIDDVRSFVDNKMEAYGKTYVALGLEQANREARSLRDTASDKYVKSIVTMSDGIPHDGSAATRLAQSMFPDYNMYSLGFFDGGDNAEAIEFLKSIQNSGYFEANDLDALIKKFIEIADELLNPVEISLSHDYTRDKADGEPIDKRSFTLRAEIKNPNQKTVKNLKVTLRLPEGLTLQGGRPLERTWKELGAGEKNKIGNLGENQTDQDDLMWEVKASDSATGPFVYSITVSGDNIVDLTQSDKITLDIQNGKDNQFIFGQDNWSFENNKENFDNQYFLTPQDKQDLYNGLTCSNREFMDLHRKNKDFYVGQCYGFAVSSILKKMDVASPLQRQEGAECLHDMNPSKNVQSYINYYHLTQFLPAAWEEDARRTEPNKDKATRQVLTVIKLRNRIKMVAEGKAPIVLSFGRNTDLGHAVVADKYEAGDFDKFVVEPPNFKKKYNDRIRYYDSNDPENKECYLYINSETGEWLVERAGIKSSDPEAYLSFMDDPFFMNVKDMKVSRENDHAILTAKGKTERSNTLLKYRDKTLSVATIADGGSDLPYWYDLGGGPGSPLNIALPDNKEDYSVSSPDAYDYSLKYPDAFLLVQSAGAESASFERGGTVKLAHNTGSYKLTSTLDSATGNLYTFGVTGTDGGDVELRKTEGGYVIKADSLKGATAEANGDDVTKSIALDGDATEVQISSDGTDITASIDEDGDGIFEKAIGSSAQGAKQGKDDNKQNKGDDGTPGPTDQGSKVSSTFNGNAGSARVSDVQSERGGGDLPKTGDSSPLFMALPLAVLGALATVLGIVLRRRRGDADSGGVDG